ncbi:MAG: alkaline phosphatase family protein [Candidatus Thermoplasmatota archaeon]|nr:alkaline phosphatase family protein [Candidatus Thermoplasmatota archaeon]
MSGKTVIIGIDGVPYDLIEGLANTGEMPNFAELLEEGNFSKMHAAIPEVSNVNWSSIVTGKNPGQHGVFGFTELIQGTYTVSFPDRRALKAEPFWKDDKRYMILNVPAMYPADEIDGVFVSGFVSPDFEKAIYPDSALKYLNDIDYKVDVDSEKAHKSYRLFLDNLFDTLEKRKKAAEHFWEKKWDVFMLVFTGSDRLEHFLIDAYYDEEHEYHERFIEYFREVDEIIGDIVEKMDEEDRLVMMSDHGMEQIKKNVNVNAVLEEHGLLKLGDEHDKRYKNIEEGTKAFALDPGRIYLNRKDRYPRGEVEDGEKTLEEMIDIFEDLTHDGEKVIKKIHRGEKVYHGDQTNKSPDLILTPNEGYNLKGSVKYDSVFAENIFSGKHTEDDAFLYCNDMPLPEDPTVEDVRSLIERDEDE